MSGRATLHNVHALRACAAMLVVLLHAGSQYDGGLALFDVDFGHAGVDIFFVISGFIMVYVSTVRPKGAREFLRDRAVRIIPMYWLFTALTALLAIFAPSVFRGTVFDPVHTLFSFLFVATPSPGIQGSVSPILRVGWTLNYEILFYLLFAIGIAVAYRMRVIVAAVFMTTLVLIGPLVREAGPVVTFYTNGIMLEFLYGMLLGVAFTRGYFQAIAAPVGYAVLIAGTLAMIFFGNMVSHENLWRFVFFGIPSAAILAGALSLEHLRRSEPARLTTLIGDASFVIYLTHPFVLSGFRLALRKFGLDGLGFLDNTIAILTMCIGSAIFGCLIHLYLEKPVQNFLNRKKKGQLKTLQGSNV